VKSALANEANKILCINKTLTLTVLKRVKGDLIRIDVGVTVCRFINFMLPLNSERDEFLSVVQFYLQSVPVHPATYV
jgi:hypothetical protein